MFLLAYCVVSFFPNSKPMYPTEVERLKAQYLANLLSQRGTRGDQVRVFIFYGTVDAPFQR